MKFIVLLVILSLTSVVEAGNQQAQTLPIHVTSLNFTFSAYIDSQIGTPAQKLALAVDFFSTNTYVADKDAAITCKDTTPALFDYSKSSTYSLVKNYTDLYDNNFLSQDVIKIGTASGNKQNFNLTNVYPTDWNCSPYSGSIGLGLAPKQDSLLVNVLKDYKQQIVTIAPSKSANDKTQQLDLTLGGSNDKACGSDWAEARCAETSEFTYPACTFAVNGYSFGDYTLKRAGSIASVSLSLQGFTYVPSDTYDRILRMVSYDESTSGIPCDTHPDLSIYIGQNEYTMDGKHYIGKALGKNYCEFLIFNGKNYGLSPDLFVLPLGFFEKNCQQLNYSKTSMSLATSK